jgi:tetratricopeptide (TPR) repeat protein
VLGLETWAEFEAAFQQAQGRFLRGDWLGAFEAFRSILFQRISGSGFDGEAAFPTQADLLIVERTADLAFLLGQREAADYLLAGMGDLCQQAGNVYGADYACLKRIHLNLEYGLLRDAYALLRGLRPTIGDVQAIRFSSQGIVQWEGTVYWPDTSQADRTVQFALLYLVMGRLLSALGQYGDALTTLERGLHHSGPDAPNLARQAKVPLQLAIAGAQMEKGDLEAARASLTSLEPQLDERQHPGHMVNWLELSGKLDLLHGEFGRALAQLTRVQEMCRRQGLSQAALRATLNLCDVLIYLNHTSLARTYLQSIQASPLVTDDRPMRIRIAALLDLAQARGRSLMDGVPVAPSVSEMWGVMREAAPELEKTEIKSPLYLPQAGNYLTFFEDRTLTFHWLLGRRDLMAAADYFRHLKQVFEKSDSLLIRARLHVMEGILAYYQGQAERAEAMLRAVQPTLRTLDLKPELWQIQRILGWCWARLGLPDEQRHALAQETQALLNELTGSLPAVDQAVFLLNKWTFDEEYIAGEINQLARLKEQMAAAPWFLRPWRRWVMMKRLHALLLHIDGYKQGLAVRTVTGKDAEQDDCPARPLWWRLLTHPRDRATFSFLVLPDRVLVVQVGWLSLDFGVSPITRLQVRDLVRDWHERHSKGSRRPAWRSDASCHLLLEESAKPRPEPSAEESRKMARGLAEAIQILAMLQQLPQRVRALTIVPDDSLHGFPFAAVPYRDKYLVEHYALSVTFERSDGYARAPAPKEGEALVVGVAEGSGDYPPLPGVRQELDLVDRWLSDRNLKVHRLADDAADKATVLDHLPKAALLHVACHGVFEHNRPDCSGLILATDSEQPEVLSLRELSNVDLGSLQHATLSSCWSADHFILPGRWIISLPETLWRAGARSILGSLWEVNDRVAVAFMARFYDYLDEHPRDEALRRTQLDCLQERLPDCDTLDTTHPAHWAGFILYGDYRRLSL